MSSSWVQAIAVAVLLAAVSAIAFPVFDNGFVYDDVDIIQHGDVIHDPSELTNVFRHHTMYVSPKHRDDVLLVDTYRPVTLVSFMWDSAISGREPWAYHLTNLVMHLLCTLLVFLVVRELLGSDRWPFALLAAAWFSLTPHPSTAHIWINGRSDLFCTAAGLAALLVWRRALERPQSLGRISRHALAASLFFIGLLSKETLLFVLPAIFLWPETASRIRARDRLTRASGFIVASLAYLGVRISVLGGLRTHEGEGHLWRTLQHLAPLEIEGVLGALWPRRLYLRFLTEELGALTTAELVGFAAAFLVLLGLLWFVRRRFPLIAWGLFWFVVCLAPATLIAGMLWPGFGRYLYLPSVGLAVAIGSFAVHLYDRLPRWRPALALTCALYLTLLAVHLRGWIEDFHDEETLYTAAIEKNPEGAHAYGWLAMSYLADGRDEDAVGPMSIAHQLAPDETRYAKELLKMLLRTQRTDAAVRLATECARRYETDATLFHMTLLNAMHMTAPEAASFQVLECLRKEPSSSECAKALEKLVISHPMKLQYRSIIRKQLQEERFAAVRQQTAPLMRSVP